MAEGSGISRIVLDRLWPTFVSISQPSVYRDGWPTRTGPVLHPSALDKNVFSEAVAERIKMAALNAGNDLQTSAGLSGRLGTASGEVCRWTPGYHSVLNATSSKYSGLIWLDLSSDDGRHSSIEVRDPRAGAANIFTPDHAFGRPISVSPLIGRMLVMPGWLAYSVPPLKPNEYQVVWKIRLD
jgi:hypothetical protein